MATAPVVSSAGKKELPVSAIGAGQADVPDPFAAGIFNTSKWSTPAPVAPVTSGNSNVVALAKTFIGTPYKWGGTSPLGFDCSGFVQYVFGRNGVALPRMSYQQADAGTNVDRNAMQPGDIVSWDNSSRNNGADHVGIYVGNGNVIAAPKPGDRVKIEPLWGDYRVTRVGGTK